MPNDYRARPFLVPRPGERPPHPINTLPAELIKKIAVYAITTKPIYDTYLDSLETLKGFHNVIREIENHNEGVVRQIIADNPNATENELTLLVEEELEDVHEQYANIVMEQIPNAKNFTNSIGRNIATYATDIHLGLGRLLSEKKVPLPTPVLVSQSGPSVPVPEPTDPPPTLRPGIPVAYPV